jgi:hypothetical protein
MNPYSNLTHETTESDLMVPVAHARARLLDLSQSYTEGFAKWEDSEHLLGAVHQVWEAEAMARAAHEIVGALQSVEGEADEYRAYVLQRTFAKILANGADDAWSGRKNDARRVAFDGVRKMINDLTWSLVPAIARPVTQEV